jgi:predicted nucleic acid-binding protein
MIFVDAGLFYARLAADDENHRAADLFFKGLSLAVPLITTNVVIYEAHALLLRLSRSGPRADVASPARRFFSRSTQAFAPWSTSTEMIIEWPAK